MSAYYNEIDPAAAQTLRNLIGAGHIAPGVVDERSIEDVRPDELVGYTQCHFFAGIGIWSHALRQAGWTDDRPVWTGSCPCQPFSSAGKGDGFADERHLWPAWFHLVSQRRPADIFGEQVASKAAEPWIDLVQADLEGLGYAFGSVPFPAAGVGAPHIRDRNYWGANTAGQGREGRGHAWHPRPGRQGATTERGCADGGLADMHGHGCESRSQGIEAARHGPTAESDCGAGWMADAEGIGRREQCAISIGCGERGRAQRLEQRPGGGLFLDSDRPAGPVNGHWADVDWLFCRDGKWRPVEPGTFPLAHGASGRVGRLRMYGNGICATQAQAFIQSVMEAA